MSQDQDLSKLDLLVKVMKMTGAEDNIALVAIRKANSMLAAEGWDWEKLLRGKVVVIGDPFERVPTPPTNNQFRSSTPPPAPARPQPRTYAPPPPPRPQPKFVPVSVVNSYDGTCCSCFQLANKGRSWAVRLYANSTWEKYCQPCHNDLMRRHGLQCMTIPTAAATPTKKWKRTKNPKSLDDLLDL